MGKSNNSKQKMTIAPELQSTPAIQEPAKEVTVKAPVEGYSGISAGIQFANGTAKISDPWLISWFLSNGYIVEGLEELAPPSASEPPADPDGADQAGTNNEGGE